MSYSPALTYFLDRLSGFSTNIFRLEAQNQDSATANKILRFTLPSNALLNMRSFALHFQADANQTAGAGGRLPAKIDTLVDRVEVACGGVQLSAGANFYNVLRHAKDALEGDKTNPVLGHPDIVRAKSYVDNTAITGTNNETYTADNKATQFCIDHWEGFLGSCEPKIIDSSLLPDIVVSIYLADNNVLSSCAGIALSGTGAGDIVDENATKATYKMDNIHATIECIGLAGSVYNNMVAGMIASAGFLEIPFKQYFSFQDTTANTMRFTVATQSLDRVWVAHRQKDFGTSAGAVLVRGHKVSGAFVDDAAGETAADIDIGVPEFDIGGMGGYTNEKYVGQYVNFKEPDTSSKNLYQFQLNGAYYPQFRATFEEMSQISRNSVNYSGKKCDYSLFTAKNNYSVQCIRLNMPESEYGRLISGLDTRSVSLNGYYNMDNVSVGTYIPTINLFCECSSTLRIGAGRMLEVVQ